jgi:hypothetical protein
MFYAFFIFIQFLSALAGYGYEIHIENENHHLKGVSGD